VAEYNGNPQVAKEIAQVTEQPFRMTISLNVLRHLGINLYSNAPAVFTEACGQWMGRRHSAQYRHFV